jgi:GDP-mannose 6-dehydrogenase
MAKATANVTEKTNTPEKKTLAVVGLGVMGCQTAALFAGAGHPVLVFDKLKSKRELVRKGKCPAFEIQVADSFQASLAAGRIRVADKLADLWKTSDIVFLSPGISDDLSTATNFGSLRRLVSEIAETFSGNSRLTLVCRYPLYLGAVAEQFGKTLQAAPHLRLVLNPAMHRQSRGITDAQGSPLHVAGSVDPSAAQEIASLYSALGLACETVRIDLAELLPHACGAFHALKVAFANEMSSIARGAGVTPDRLLQLLAKDTLLNASSAYLTPGNAYSGPHLPRSVRHMAELASAAKLKAPLLTHIEASNNEHFDRLAKQIKDVQATRIGLFGLAYRPDTDDTRGSNAVHIAESLLKLGKEVRIYDPQIQYDRLDANNWQSLLMQLPLAERLLTPNFNELLDWSQHLILVHAPTKGQAQQIESKALPVLNWSGTVLDRVA